MRITPQQQRIPLVDLNTGLIRREWIGALTADSDSGTTDLTALENALALLTARVLDLEARATQAETRLAALEAQQALPMVVQAGPAQAGAVEVVLQPAAPGRALTMVVQPCWQ